MTEYVVYPDGKIKKPDGEVVESLHPVQWVAEWAEPGAVATLMPGRYLPFDVSSPHALLNKPIQPSLFRAATGVVPGEWPNVADDEVVWHPPHAGASDCLMFARPSLHSGIAFDRIVFESGYRSAVIYSANPDYHFQDPGPFTHHAFTDCHVRAFFDWTTGTSKHPMGHWTKWGVLANWTSDWSWIGGSVTGVWEQQDYYFHNAVGPHMLRKVMMRACGRSNVQLANRENENAGGWGGDFFIEECELHDSGGTDGGSGLTASGQSGILVRACDFRNTVEAMQGTGHLVIWPEYDPPKGKHGRPNGRVILYDNVFTSDGGFGDREVAKISACDLLWIEKNQFIANGFGEEGAKIALSIDPIGKNQGGMASELFPTGAILPPGGKVVTSNVFDGKVYYKGELIELP